MSDIQWKYTSDFDEASQWLADLPDQPIGCDFETSSRWSAEDKDKFKASLPFAQKWPSIKLKQKIFSDGLSHPALTTVTHFSCAVSRTEAFVIIIDTDEMLEALMEWLVTDSRTQIWHNLGLT